MTLAEYVGNLLWALLGPNAFIGLLMFLVGIVGGMFALRFTIAEALMGTTLLTVGFASLAINPMFESMKLLALVINGLVIAFFIWKQVANG